MFEAHNEYIGKEYMITMQSVDYAILPHDSVVVLSLGFQAGDIFKKDGKEIHVLKRPIYEYFDSLGFSEWSEEEQERTLSML